MYVQATAVRTVVKNTDTTLTPLLSSMFIPEILVTVGPSTPTTYKQKQTYTTEKQSAYESQKIDM